MDSLDIRIMELVWEHVCPVTVTHMRRVVSKTQDSAITVRTIPLVCHWSLIIGEFMVSCITCIH